MKITKSQLKQIIKEELTGVLAEADISAAGPGHDPRFGPEITFDDDETGYSDEELLSMLRGGHGAYGPEISMTPEDEATMSLEDMLFFDDPRLTPPGATRGTSPRAQRRLDRELAAMAGGEVEMTPSGGGTTGLTPRAGPTPTPRRGGFLGLGRRRDE
jgi:hypothetical protein